jgi:MFS family permease
VPGIRDQLGCTPTQLAFALVCMGVGSILGMPFAGRLVDRYSSRVVSLLTTFIALGGWTLVPLARSVAALALILLITGVGTGVGDVAMNVQGHLVETRRQKVWMPYWHGLFSVGAVVGALAGAFAASLRLPIAWQLLGVSAVFAVAMGLATSATCRTPVCTRAPGRNRLKNRSLTSRKHSPRLNRQPVNRGGRHSRRSKSCSGS